MPRGGRRRNQTGRPKNDKPKVRILIEEDLAEKLKCGYFEAIEALIIDWQFRQEDALSYTRNWTRMNEFLEEFGQLQKNYPTVQKFNVYDME